MVPMAFVQERVFHALKADYLAGQFVPGQKLDIQQIADRHGASRTPVREAACILVGQGILEHHAESGFMVPDYGPAAVVDLLTWHMQMMVAIVAGLKLSGLRAALLRFQGRMEAVDRTDLAHRTSEIFVAIAAVAANRRLTDDVRLMNERLHYVRLKEATGLSAASNELRILVNADVMDLHKSMRRRLESYHLRRIRPLVDMIFPSNM